MVIYDMPLAIVRRKLHMVNLVTHAGKAKEINESTSRAIS